MNKKQYLEQVECIANKHSKILNHHLSNCFKRFAEDVLNLNKVFQKDNGDVNTNL